MSKETSLFQIDYFGILIRRTPANQHFISIYGHQHFYKKKIDPGGDEYWVCEVTHPNGKT